MGPTQHINIENWDVSFILLKTNLNYCSFLNIFLVKLQTTTLWSVLKLKLNVVLLLLDGVFIALFEISNDSDCSVWSTHGSYPQDTLNAGEGKVENSKTHNSVHYCPQARPERTQQDQKIIFQLTCVDNKKYLSNSMNPS